MFDNLDVILLNGSNEQIEEKILPKPTTFEELISLLKENINNLPENYHLFFYSDNNEININNNEDYQLLQDILFIRENDNNNQYMEQSIFSINYNNLSESKKEIIDNKYNCSICHEHIKKENPYICNRCQKIIHIKCLKDWEQKRERQNLKLNCPNCRYELPLKFWKNKSNFEQNRLNDNILCRELNKSQLNDNLNNDKNKLNELENKIIKINQKYNNFVKIIYDIFKNCLMKINEIELSMNIHNNINNVIYQLSSNSINIPINSISNLIYKELDKIKNNVNESKKTNNNIKIIQLQDNFMPNVNKKALQNNYIQQINYSINDHSINNDINYQQENVGENINPSYFYPKNNNPQINNSNVINLTYKLNYEVSSYQFFGKEFIQNNINNIEIIINNEKCNLADKFNLKKGLYYVKMIIKKKLINLESMFNESNFLINIDDLKFLDTSGVTNFSNIFKSCGELSDIKSLEFWNVSNGKDFSGMFQDCYNLKNIKSLEKWNVTKGRKFSNMFSYCSKLSDINPLQNWNISNCEDLSSMFYGCKSLKDISPIKNWNVSNVYFFKYLFSNCPISNLNPIKNWDISNGNSFSHMFDGCSLLSNLEPIRYWNLSKCEDFSYMFCGCSSLLDIRPLENWNVRNGNNFSGMFKNCANLSDIRPLANWNVINGRTFNAMFYECSPLLDLKILTRWNLSENELNEINKDFHCFIF